MGGSALHFIGMHCTSTGLGYTGESTLHSTGSALHSRRRCRCRCRRRCRCRLGPHCTPLGRPKQNNTKARWAMCHPSDQKKRENKKKGRGKCSLRLRGVSNVHFSQQTRAANSKRSTAASKQISPGARGSASPQRENSVLYRSLDQRDRVSRMTTTS